MFCEILSLLSQAHLMDTFSIRQVKEMFTFIANQMETDHR